MNIKELKELNTSYQNALEDILKCNRLDVAKELAADALDIDPEEYINPTQELNFDEDY